MMGAESAEQPQEREWTWLFPWCFHSIEELCEDGLEAYSEMSEGLKVNRYGRLLGDEPGGESYLCALRRHKEIDMSLLVMQEVGQRRLLDVYFRQGLNLQHRGWARAASLVRVQGVKPRQCPGAAVRCQVADNRRDLVTCSLGRHCQWD